LFLLLNNSFVIIKKMTKGKLVVIEGTDGSGKATQLKLLIEFLKRNETNFETFDFPQYEKTFFGKFVGRFLNGEFGHFSRINPYLAMFPFAGDRWQVKEKLWKAINAGKLVLCNRYSPSDIYQAVKVKPKEQSEFLSWTDQLEHEVFAIPRPDLVIVLYVPFIFAQKLIELKNKRSYLNGKDKDQYEEDIKYLERVEKMYLLMIKKNKHWVKIDCVKNGKILSPEVIHQKILGILRKKGYIS